VRDYAADSMTRKKPTVILGSWLSWGALVVGVIWPWIHRIDLSDDTLSVLAHLSATIWWVVLLWAIHHLAFQLGGILTRRQSNEVAQAKEPAVAVLYTTCDDFETKSCLSLLQQRYSNYRVYVCDDSKEPHYREMVEHFCGQFEISRCRLVRRSGNRGFKAGNLNHAIADCVVEEWILLVDADQRLPPDYLTQFVSVLPYDDPGVAFVQGSHDALAQEQNSVFQRALAPGVRLYYFRDLAIRESHGFMPLLGHGAMIRRTAWESLGGFPEIVSEDFAFALRAASVGLRGRFVPEIVSHEAVPSDFGGFMVRTKKFAAGTAELLRLESVSFWRGAAELVEKWDVVMMLVWYALMPFVTINGFLGAYVCHRLWEEGVRVLHPLLPYLYSWMLVFGIALTASITEGLGAAVRFYFWSTAIYTASVPLSGLSFIKHLFRPATFNRTPKNGEKTKPTLVEASFMVILGLLAMYFAWAWKSPFSPVLGGQGVSYLLYPLYGQSEAKSKTGTLVRALVYVPGCLALFALYAVWRWGYFWA